MVSSRNNVTANTRARGSDSLSTIIPGDPCLASHFCPDEHTLPRHSSGYVLTHNYGFECPALAIQSVPFSFLFSFPLSFTLFFFYPFLLSSL